MDALAWLAAQHAAASERRPQIEAAQRAHCWARVDGQRAATAGYSLEQWARLSVAEQIDAMQPGELRNMRANPLLRQLYGTNFASAAANGEFGPDGPSHVQDGGTRIAQMMKIISSSK